MNRALVAAFALLAGCECAGPAKPTPVATPEPPSRLRVPRPEGWTATPASSGALQVGPQGRVVLQLESSERALPSVDALTAAVVAEEAEILQKESNESFVGVRYSIVVAGVKQEAFVGVRRVGAVTIWCATVGGARVEEVEQAMTVCRSVSWEG